MKVNAFLIDKGAGINARGKAIGSSTPLHTTAKYNYLAEVKLLLARCANVIATDKWGSTPLHYASFNGHNDLIKLFLAKGAKINHQERCYGIMALHAAVAGRKIRTGELLIAIGADINVRNHARETHLVAVLRMNQIHFADLLRKHGARK